MLGRSSFFLYCAGERKRGTRGFYSASKVLLRKVGSLSCPLSGAIFLRPITGAFVEGYRCGCGVSGGSGPQ